MEKDFFRICPDLAENVEMMEKKKIKYKYVEVCHLKKIPQ